MTKEKIFEMIRQHIVEVIPDFATLDIKPSDSLRTLGANSLDRADIIMMTMEALSLNIPRVELFGPQNLEELVDLIVQKLAEQKDQP